MAVEQVGNILIAVAQFTTGGAGATGLTVVCDTYRSADGVSWTSIATGSACTEIAYGHYSYAIPSGSNTVRSFYLFIFRTTGTADLKQVAAAWPGVGSPWVANIDTAITTIAAAVWDRLTSALTPVGSIGKWILDKLDVAVSSRAATGATLTTNAPGPDETGALTIFAETDYLGSGKLIFTDSNEDFTDVTSVKLVTEESDGTPLVLTGAVASGTQLSVEITAATEPAATLAWSSNGYVQMRAPYPYQVQVVRTSPARNTVPFYGALNVRPRLEQS